MIVNGERRTGTLINGERSSSGGGGTVPSLTITFESSLEDTSVTDNGAIFQVTGGHTMAGGATYFDTDQFVYFTRAGVGPQPVIPDHTGHEVPAVGASPVSPEDLASQAAAIIAALGYTTLVTGASVEVSGNGVNPAGAIASQEALTSFADAGLGSVIGSTEQAAGSSTASNTTGWVQVDPDEVPDGEFRVLAFGIRRGANVASGVRMSLATGGLGDGNPQANVTQHQRTMGNSGPNAWHYEWLRADEVVTLSGSPRIFLGLHGDGGASSVFGGSSVDAGLFADGGGNTLWLTDGTSGANTPIVSPAGPVTGSFTFGLAVRILIQEAPYHNDSRYRVIAGAVPGRHDQDLFASGTPVNHIFVRWTVVAPNLEDIALQETAINLQAHAAGDSNQIAVELWRPLSGPDTLNGDVRVATIGITSDTQGTLWSFLEHDPIPLEPGGEYGVSIKGAPEAGSEDDTRLNVWLGTDGAGSEALAGYPVYGPPGVAVANTEREVDANLPPPDTPETSIDFRAQVPTASPNPSDGTVIEPQNLGMLAYYLGKPGPTLTAGTTVALPGPGGLG